MVLLQFGNRMARTIGRQPKNLRRKLRKRRNYHIYLTTYTKR